MDKVYEELEKAKAEIVILEDQLSLANDTLEGACNEKIKYLEDENKQLLMLLDEANERDKEKQLKIEALTDESNNLKALISDLQMKSCGKEMICEGNHVIKELEERWKNAEDELNSTTNQFKHLEEAHRKLQDQFQASKCKWEIEKSLLINEISKLLESLNDGFKTTEGLRSQLDMCKQVLDHEDCRKKHLKAQVSKTLRHLEKKDEGNSQAQEMTRELVCDQVIEELKKEQEDCHSSLTEFSQGVSHQLRQDKKDDENSSLAEAQSNLENESEVEVAMLKEIDKFKDMLDESSQYQFNLMEEAVDTERKLKDELQELNDCLQRLDCELLDKTNKESELEFELQAWNSLAEYLEVQLDENMAIRRNLEESLLAQAEIEEMLKKDIEEKNKKISNYEKQIMLFDQECLIGEESNLGESETTSIQRLQIDDNDEEEQHEQELLAKELELALLTHIMAERNYTKRIEDMGQTRNNSMTKNIVGDDDMCSAIENIYCEHWTVKNTDDVSIFEARSPFKELNN